MRTIINIEAIGYAYEAGSFVSGLILSVEQLRKLQNMINPV